MAKPRKRKANRVPVAKPPVETSPGVQEPVVAVAAPEEVTVAPAGPTMLGPVACRLKQLSTKVVLGLLSPDGLRRVEAYTDSPTFESETQRLLATDGNATPVIFEDGDGDIPPSILHGYEELAGAVATGAEQVNVLLVPAGGAAEAQSYIVEMVRQRHMKQQSPDDDELLYRVIHAQD